MQKGQLQLQGIPFPYVVRDQGASVELLRLEIAPTKLADWAMENLMLEGDKQWGIITHARSKEESIFLSLAFRKVQKAGLKLQNGRIERFQEEATEPEMGEFHLRRDADRRDGGILELYSYSAKQKTMLLRGITESFGEEAVSRLCLSKDAMKSMMVEAIEVNSVSLTGLGNPFFSDATFAGTDPMNSKTYKELLGSGGEIKSFRAKFPVSTFSGAGSEVANADDGGDSSARSSGSQLMVSVSSANCKVRFFGGGQSAIAQSDIEDFSKKVCSIASVASELSV